MLSPVFQGLGVTFLKQAASGIGDDREGAGQHEQIFEDETSSARKIGETVLCIPCG